MTDNGDLGSSTQNNSFEAQYNRHNSSYEDEDSFFDAIDAVDNELCKNLKNIHVESATRKNSTEPHMPVDHKKSGNYFRFDKETIESTEDEEDSKTFFYDTATSRHTSELNAEDNNDANKTISDGEDDDDEQDAELETAWSFWIDRLDFLVLIQTRHAIEYLIQVFSSCARGTSKDDYEAGLRLIHTVKTVQVFKLI